MTTLFVEAQPPPPPQSSCLESARGPPASSWSGRGRAAAQTNPQQRIKLSRELMLKLSAALSAAANHQLHHHRPTPATTPKPPNAAPATAQSKPPQRADLDDEAQPMAGAASDLHEAAPTNGNDDDDDDDGDNRSPTRLFVGGQSCDGCKKGARELRRSSGCGLQNSNAATATAIFSTSFSFSANMTTSSPTIIEGRKPLTSSSAAPVWLPRRRRRRRRRRQQKVSRNCCYCCRRYRLRQQQQRQQLVSRRPRRLRPRPAPPLGLGLGLEVKCAKSAQRAPASSAVRLAACSSTSRDNNNNNYGRQDREQRWAASNNGCSCNCNYASDLNMPADESGRSKLESKLLVFERAAEAAAQAEPKVAPIELKANHWRQTAIDCGHQIDRYRLRPIDGSHQHQQQQQQHRQQRQRQKQQQQQRADINDESHLTAGTGSATEATFASADFAQTFVPLWQTKRPAAVSSSSKTTSTSAAKSTIENRKITTSSLISGSNRCSGACNGQGEDDEQEDNKHHHNQHATSTCRPRSNNNSSSSSSSVKLREPHESSVIFSSASSRPLKRAAAASQPVVIWRPPKSRSSAKARQNPEARRPKRAQQPGGQTGASQRAARACGSTAQGGLARRQPGTARRCGRSSWSWPVRGLLLAGLFVCLLSGSGGLTEGPRHGDGELASPSGGPSPSASTSDELSRAILATMSTQSPSTSNEFANETNGQHELGLDRGDLSSYGSEPPTTTAAEARSILERFLDFGRIFIMSAIIVGDICGNSLVILSVCRHTKLRVTTNWFVVSLACADILVALFAMTFNASVIISGRWLFKRWVCDFWNSCDVLASTASILHLCCISIDRYIAIMRPLDYPMKITTRRVMYALCGVWISSALLSYIPIFTGIYTTAEHIEWLRENPDQCDFVVNRVYAIVSSSISFWIPCCIMVFTYYRIYREATRQEKFIYNAQKIMPAPQPNHHHHHHHHSNSSSASKSANAGAHKRRSKSVAAPSASAGADKQARIRHLANQQLEQQKQATPGAASSVATTELNSASSLTVGAADRAGSLQQLPLESHPLNALAGPTTDLNNNSGGNGNGAAPKSALTFEKPAAMGAGKQPQPQPQPEELSDDEPDSNSGQSTPTKRSISKMKREHKAAKTLGIIMGVFILCWLPFFSWYTPQHICGHACDGMVPGWAVTILFWIGYFNSTLNPIIYAYFNHEFRDAFKKTLQWIFCCCQDLKCLRVNRPNDNQHYNCTYRSTQEIGLVSNG